MCNAYTLHSTLEALRRLFRASGTLNLPERLDAFPGRDVVVVRDGRIELAHWGFLPAWARRPLTNAKSEDIKPTFAAAFRQRRCLVPATAYYEWSGAKGSKVKHAIRPADQDVFSFAGLWQEFQVKGEARLCVTIMTTQPSPAIAAIHNRMPVILPADGHAAWLAGDAAPLLGPYGGPLTAEPPAPG